MAHCPKCRRPAATAICSVGSSSDLIGHDAVIRRAMENDILGTLRDLTDGELVDRVKSLAARERSATALLVAHLAELDTRDVHLRSGYSSLFAYCRDVLRLSEHAAYNRIEAARAARRFPLVLRMLEGGSVNLTTVRLLAPHLTPGNHRAVLESARGKRKGEVEAIVASVAPRPDVPPSLRKLPAPKPIPGAPAASHETPGPARAVETAGAPGASDGAPSGAAGPLTAPPGAAVSSRPAAAARPATLGPLSPDRYKLQLTIAGDTVEKLRLAKDMLRHAIPSGNEATVLDRALDALLADLAKKKFAATDKPRPARKATPGSRHVPARVKRVVWLRDLGRCAFVASGGRRCTERAFLEFHHVRPWVVGGEASPGNIELRCKRHNGYEARAYFGRERGATGADGRRGQVGAGVVREGIGRRGVEADGGTHGVSLDTGAEGMGAGLVREDAVAYGTRALVTCRPPACSREAIPPPTRSGTSWGSERRRSRHSEADHDLRGGLRPARLSHPEDSPFSPSSGV
jgi:hypothetical protein